MKSIGINDLHLRTGDIVRLVHEQGETVEVTDDGTVLARLVPVPALPSAEEAARIWARWDLLAAEIGRQWPEGVSALDAVNEQRRTL